MRRMIKVEALEFDEGGRTLWVQGELGTVLRVQLPHGSVFKTTSCGGPGSSHADLTIEKLCLDHDIVVCLGEDEL